MNYEMNKEIEASVEKECVGWLQDQLAELSGFDVDDGVISEGIKNYLDENNKNILELNQADKENIFADVLTKVLDGEV